MLSALVWIVVAAALIVGLLILQQLSRIANTLGAIHAELADYFAPPDTEAL